MSKENVRRYFAALAKESDLQKKFGEMNARLSEMYGEASPDEKELEAVFQNELLPALRESGFVFSFQDLKEYAEESKGSEELADEEMGAVAAGVGFTSVGETEFVGIGTMSGSGHCKCTTAGSGTG